MRRRDFLRTLGTGSAILLLPARLRATQETLLRVGNTVSLRCLANANGPRYLDGRIGDATVGLVPNLNLTKKFSGTKWLVAGRPDTIWLQCLGSVEGSWFLAGRAQDGTVGLTALNPRSFTGARWEVVQLDDNDLNIVGIGCLGGIEPRWLDGRPFTGTVGLAKTTDPPFTGTKWEVRLYPVCIDDPC